MKRNNKKGFTLAELLIVVAIIAVLVAIAIPVFNNQLEKAREATDAANIRNAISEVTVQYLSADVVADAGYKVTVTLKQQKDGWQDTSIAFLDSKGTAITTTGSPEKGKTVDVTMDKDGVLKIAFANAA